MSAPSRRVDIASMLAETTEAVAETTPQQAPTPEPQTVATASRSKAKTTRRTKKPAVGKRAVGKRAVVAQERSEARQGSGGGKLTQLEPRTIYIWPESVDDLQAVARRLQRSKAAGEGERITMATLVRVAIARLLDDADQLSGVDETEILARFRELSSPDARS